MAPAKPLPPSRRTPLPPAATLCWSSALAVAQPTRLSAVRCCVLWLSSASVVSTTIQTDTVATSRAVDLDLTSVGGEALGGILSSDTMLVKCTCRGSTYEIVRRKMLRALVEFRIRGVKTNIPFLEVHLTSIES
jgi:hypothetical protein